MARGVQTDTETQRVVDVAAPWHLESEGLASRLRVDPGRGLDSAEAERRLRTLGPNRLREAPSRPWWQVLLAQIASPLNLVLVVAAVLAGAVERSFTEAVVIGLVLGMNGVLGFVQERRADSAVAALKGLLSPSARVRRDGDVVEIPATIWCPATSSWWRRVI